ncbi:MAG: metallophosphoesterase [Rectinemataceae bacterium]|nr:metallophosphoesterase [Rectinemataceae bacterium]
MKQPEPQGTPNPTQAEERSIVIVSDLHLGGNEDHGTMARFNRFLEALETADTRPIPITDPEKTFGPCLRINKLSEQKKPERIYKPEKIILLGDFLEFWDSKDQNRDNVFFDALFPLLRLRDMDCETIYVTGNHDEDLRDLIECGARLPNEKGETARKFWDTKIKPLYENQETGEKLHGINISWSGSHSLHIHARAYAPPVKDGKNGIEKGGITYSFLHGHQFDKEQVIGTLDEGFSRLGADFRCDIIDYFEDIANISAAKSINPYLIGVMLLVTIFLSVIFFANLRNVLSAIGFFFGAVLVLGFLGMAVLFGKVAADLPSSKNIARGSVGLFCLMVIIFALYYIANLLSDLLIWLFLALLAVSVYLTVVIVVPCIIAYGKRGVYNHLLATKGDTIEDILKGGSFHFNRFSHYSDVLIFGHTHKPDICHIPSFMERENIANRTSLVWILNTGSWVRDPVPEKTGQDPEEVDTFVYIDSKGVSLMSWKDETGDAVCLYHIRNWLPTRSENI